MVVTWQAPSHSDRCPPNSGCAATVSVEITAPNNRRHDDHGRCGDKKKTISLATTGCDTHQKHEAAILNPNEDCHATCFYEVFALCSPCE